MLQDNKTAPSPKSSGRALPKQALIKRLQLLEAAYVRAEEDNEALRAQLQKASTALQDKQSEVQHLPQSLTRCFADHLSDGGVPYCYMD